MTQLKKYLLIPILSFASCEKQITENGTSSLNSDYLDSGIFPEDLLDESILKKVLVGALHVEDLDWLDDGSPAMRDGKAYTGWVQQSNDSVSGVACLKEGFDDGPFLFIHSNGKPMLNGTFSDGLKSGKWTSWNEVGQVESEEIWLRGEKID